MVILPEVVSSAEEPRDGRRGAQRRQDPPQEKGQGEGEEESQRRMEKRGGFFITEGEHLLEELDAIQGLATADLESLEGEGHSTALDCVFVLCAVSSSTVHSEFPGISLSLVLSPPPRLVSWPLPWEARSRNHPRSLSRAEEGAGWVHSHGLHSPCTA